MILPRTKDKEPQVAAKYCLCDVTRLDALDEITFRVTIGQNIITIVDDGQSTILTDIYHNLQSIQPPSVLPQIDPALISHAPIDWYASVQKRYRAKLAWQDAPANPETIKTIERFLKRQPRTIDLGIIEDLGINVPIFLEAISVQPMIATVLVPSRPQSSYYDILWHFFQLPTTIVTTLTIVDSVHQDFHKFLLRLAKLGASSLSTIHIVGVDVSRTTIEKLHAFLSNGKIKLSLSFMKCCIQDCEERMISFIETSKNLLGIHITTV